MASGNGNNGANPSLAVPVVVSIVRETNRFIIAFDLSEDACRAISAEQGADTPRRKDIVDWLQRVIREHLPENVFPC